MTEEAFDYTRRLFCNYVHALLYYSCILCVNGLDETDLVQQRCTCSSASCEHFKVVSLKPLPDMVQDAERILHENSSGNGNAYGIKEEADIECDLKSHDSDYDSFMEMESVSSESISDDGDESLHAETDDTHFNVGENLA